MRAHLGRGVTTLMIQKTGTGRVGAPRGHGRPRGDRFGHVLAPLVRDFPPVTGVPRLINDQRVYHTLFFEELSPTLRTKVPRKRRRKRENKARRERLLLFQQRRLGVRRLGDRLARFVRKPLVLALAATPNQTNKTNKRNQTCQQTKHKPTKPNKTNTNKTYKK